MHSFPGSTLTNSMSRAPIWALAAGFACALFTLWPAALSAAEPAAPVELSRPLSAEERLDAIRRGLVQAALQGATRVESVAWLDAQGRLHESSSFRSGMQVRGVQVLGYMRDRDGQTQAQLSLPPVVSDVAQGTPSIPSARQDLVKVAGAPAAGSERCAPQANRLRHLIELDLSVAGRWTAQDAPLAHVLAEAAGAVWVLSPATSTAPEPAAALPTLPIWQMLIGGQGAPRTGQDTPRTPYEQALLGISTAPLPWRAHLQVVPSPSPATPETPSLFALWRGTSPPLMTAQISLNLQANDSLRPGLRLSADIPLLREPSQWGRPQLTLAVRAQLQAVLASWRQALDAHLSCEPVRPDIVASANGVMRMNAGALAGIQPGEEWLVGDPQAFPERVLAPGAAAQLVLAKVIKVQARHAELQAIAGPARSASPGWRAWRAESPLPN